MIPERMLRVEIVVASERARGLVTLLHEAGAMELEIGEMRPSDLLDGLKEEARKLSTLVRMTRPVPDSKREALSAALRPAPVVPRARGPLDAAVVLREARELTAGHGPTLEAHSRRREIRARRGVLEEEMAAIAPVLDAPVRLSDVGKRNGYLLAFVRTDDGARPEEALWMNPDASLALVALTDTKDIDRFDSVELPSADSLPTDRTAELSSGIEALDSEMGDLDAVISAARRDHARFRAAREDVRNAMRQERAAASLGSGMYVSRIEGWVPASSRDDVESIVRRAGGELAHATFHESDGGPTIVRHPGWAEPFAGIVGLYGTPSRREIDPTTFTAVTFILTFGLMMGDIGYGLIILGLSVWGHRVIGRTSPTVKGASLLGIELGLSTLVVGILTGSLFGDIHSSVLGMDDLYHLEVAGVVLPVDMMDNLTGLMLTAILIGIAMLYASIIIGAVNDAMRRDMRSLVLKRVSWAVLVPSGIVMVAHSLFDVRFGGAIEALATALAISGLALIVVDTKLFFLFEITGMLGDVLSFIRIMALGLSTVLLAMALNAFAMNMGGLLPLGIGTAVLLLLLVVGHVGNLVIGILGAGVQSLRLQFVETYKRFYAGEGRPYLPFRAERLYTEVNIGERYP